MPPGPPSVATSSIVSVARYGMLHTITSKPFLRAPAPSQLDKINKIFSHRRKILSNIPGLGVKSDARLDDLSCEQIMEAAHATT